MNTISIESGMLQKERCLVLVLTNVCSADLWDYMACLRQLEVLCVSISGCDFDPYSSFDHILPSLMDNVKSGIKFRTLMFTVSAINCQFCTQQSAPLLELLGGEDALQRFKGIHGVHLHIHETLTTLPGVRRSLTSCTVACPANDVTACQEDCASICPMCSITMTQSSVDWQEVRRGF